MKHLTKFNAFLSDTVNLNQTRIDTLKSRTATIKSFIQDSNFGPDILEFSTQGSWAHKTIIKPVKDTNEFDADMVVYVGEVDGYEPKDYVQKLYKIFHNNGTYKPLVSRKSRCVTINYTGDFHLDIVPITVREHFFSDDSYRVCNRNTNEFELTDGDGFKDWWKDKDKIVSNHRLIKGARLIKYLRDTKTTFSCKSILLTTLIGSMIDEEEIPIFESTLRDGFEDVPTTFKTVFGRLDDYLQERPIMPDIKNPVLEEESFTRNWTEDQYQNFRNTIHMYRGWIDDAYDETDRTESIRKWRKLFGEGFAPDVILEVSKANMMATNDDFEFGKPNLLLKEMKAEAEAGVVDTNKLLELIHLGIQGKVNWEEVKSLAQSSYGLANNNADKDVAKINFYQIYRHRGFTLSQKVVEDIEATMSKNSGSSAFKMCGNILLGTVTKEMIQNCIASGLYHDVISWPIMKLAPAELLSP